jgi:phosphoglycerol transferase
MVYQLPFQPFPEGEIPHNGVGSYDNVRLSLFTSDIKWSYGAVRGRPEADWQNRVDPADAISMTARLAAAGFTGLTVYRSAYADRGADIEARLGVALRSRPQIVSEAGNYSYWDLSGLRTALHGSYYNSSVDRLGFDTLYVIPAYADTSDFTIAAITPEGDSWYSISNSGNYVLDNSHYDSRKIILSFFARLPTNDYLSVRLSDGRNIELSYEDLLEEQRIELMVPPGRSIVTFATQDDSQFFIDRLTTEANSSSSFQLLKALRVAIPTQ